MSKISIMIIVFFAAITSQAKVVSCRVILEGSDADNNSVLNKELSFFHEVSKIEKCQFERFETQLLPSPIKHQVTYSAACEDSNGPGTRDESIYLEVYLPNQAGAYVQDFPNKYEGFKSLSLGFDTKYKDSALNVDSYRLITHCEIK